MEDQIYKFDAFISYRHIPKDEKVARRLQKRLEQYVPPVQAAKNKKRLSIFLDDSELSAGGDLWERIHAKLAESKYLILVCSRETKKSPYCMDEIRTFKAMHGGGLEHVLILLLEGKSEEVLPEELTFETRETRQPDGSMVQDRHSFKPLFCNLCADTEEETLRLLDRELLRLAAPLFECEYDDLVQRHLKRKEKRKAILMAACGVCIVLASLFLYGFYRSRCAQALTYENAAESCMENGEWAEALMYYGRALSLDAARKPSQTGALLLLQQQTWPFLVREEEDTVIWGDTLCPRYYSGERMGKSSHWCISVDTGGGYMLWENYDAKEIYSVTDLEANPLYTLGGKGTALYTGPSPCWTFYRADNQTFTFYWPGDQTERSLIWKNESYGFRKYPAVCPLDRERVVVNDNRNLYLYGLEPQGGQERMHFSLDGLFENGPAQCGDAAWAQAEKDGMGLSPDGSLLAVNASVSWEENGNMRAWSATAFFDTESMDLLTVIETEDYILSNIVFSADGAYFLLLYDDGNEFTEDGGFAAVYAREGGLLFSTEAEPSFSPKDAAFCGDLLLIWNYNTMRFWEISKAQECAIPLKTPVYVTGATMTEDGQLAICWMLDVHYYQFVRFEGIHASDFQNYSFDRLTDTSIGQAIAIADGIYVRPEDEKTLILTDGAGTVYDSVSLDAYARINALSDEIFYSSLIECLFLYDDQDSLYCFPLRVGQKKFRAADDAEIGGYIGCVCPAKDGIYYWNYVTNAVRYLTTDIFDPMPQYFGWEEELENPGILQAIGSDGENYLIFVLWDSTKEEVVVELRDLEDGTYIHRLALDQNFFVLGFQAPGLIACVSGDKTAYIQMGAPWPPSQEMVRQLLRMSGCTLDEYQHITAKAEPVRLNCFGNWLECLVWSPGQ